MMKRVNVDVDEDGQKTLLRQKDRGLSITVTIKNALKVYDWIITEQRAGRRIYSSNGQDRKEVVFL